MNQLFSKPDRYIGRCGHLRCRVTENVVPGAPAFMSGLRALFVADAHVVPRTTDAELEDLVNRMAALSPDILLLGGDYADRAEDCARFFRALSTLRPPLGSFGVLGNNDREAWPEVEALRDVMADAGCRLLVNASAKVPLRGGRLWIGGLDEYQRGAPDPRRLYPRAAGPMRYRVLLSHYPRPVDPMPDLMLSGHTHGGQFNLLGLTPFSIGFERLLRSDLASSDIAGLHARGGGQVLVSKGIGASRIQLRVGVAPEINLVTFSADDPIVQVN